jgi:hypothetical protein
MLAVAGFIERGGPELLAPPQLNTRELAIINATLANKERFIAGKCTTLPP